MSTAKERFEILNRLQHAGFSYAHANTLRRISMTLSRWSELECGDGNEYGSWAIERDEITDKPYIVRHYYAHGQGQDKVRRTPIPDREKGALKRLAALMAQYPDFVAYYQTDPRGCAVYVVRKSDIPEGVNIDSVYNRGIAVY